MSANAWRSFSSIVSGVKDLLRIHDAHDAVQPHALAQDSSRKVSAMPDGSATPLASSRCTGLLVAGHDLRHGGARSSRMLQQTQPLARLMTSPPLYPDDELGVDVDRAEVVHQHRDPQAVVAREDAIQQRRLAGAEESGEDRERRGHFAPPAGFSRRA
jgi:hypothetical protein